MSEYEPGTIARVTDPVHGEQTGLLVGHCWHFVFEDGGFHTLDADAVVDAQRLVVLDLEYPGLTVNVLRQIAKRIRKHHGTSVEDDQIADQIADQIEAQTKPPKPDEPQGLGAVVEDSRGVRWSRSQRYTAGPWDQEGKGDGGFPWTSIDAVKVLSEGVTS